MKTSLFTIFILIGLTNLSGCSSTKHQVTINAKPTKRGTVSPSGGEYKAGTKLKLTAQPDSGWEFVKWKGDLTGTNNPGKITVTDSLKITAVFEKKNSSRIQSQDVILLWGQITKNKLVLKPAFRIEAPASMPQQKGPYTLSGYDKSGLQLFSFSFEGAPVADLPNGNETRQFSFTVPVGQVDIKSLQMIKLSSEDLETVQQANVPAQRVDMKTEAKPHISAQRVNTNMVNIQWDDSQYQMALVKDAQTGEVIGYIKKSGTEIMTDAQVLKIYLSDGVHTVRRKIDLNSAKKNSD